jgi:hypothetical protein
MEKLYVQYGCGLCAPDEWLNFDASPTLRIQKLPLIEIILPRNVTFPANVKYGDIITGLPVNSASCDGVYCSHTLEHLSLADFRKALKNTYDILKPGGIFRCIVPDLEHSARNYISALDKGVGDTSSITFMSETMLGLKERPRGVKNIISRLMGNANHLWMWDSKSLISELKNVGFTNVRICKYSDSGDSMFQYVEDPNRFIHSVAVHCTR